MRLQFDGGGMDGRAVLLKLEVLLSGRLVDELST